jgi:hypothetical protein
VGIAWTRRRVIGTLLAAGTALVAGCSRRVGRARRDSVWIAGSAPPALRAAVDRILPGAAAAGAIEFIERELQEKPFAFARREFNNAAAAMEKLARTRHHKPFADLDAETQDGILTEFQSGAVATRSFDGAAFFRRLYTFTVESFLGDPKYGGNRGEVGWKLAGWDPCWWSPRKLDVVVRRRGKLPY